MDDGYTGGIFCIQSQVSLLNYHPHIHALVLAGIRRDEIFHEQKNISTRIIAEIFRARLLTGLLEDNTSATYTIMQFMVLIADHIPYPYESLVYYYGVYSNSYRGKEKRENIK